MIRILAAGRLVDRQNGRQGCCQTNVTLQTYANNSFLFHFDRLNRELTTAIGTHARSIRRARLVRSGRETATYVPCPAMLRQAHAAAVVICCSCSFWLAAGPCHRRILPDFQIKNLTTTTRTGVCNLDVYFTFWSHWMHVCVSCRSHQRLHHPVPIATNV